MALSLKDLGVVAYMDTKYGPDGTDQGGYPRFKKLVHTWPKNKVAEEYDISRPWLDRLINEMPEEDKPNAN